MSTIRRRLMMTDTSPYSAEATRVLKDTFGAEKWKTIKDYGFAHPELAPFINEDPMLIMSLVDGLGIRVLHANNAYINTKLTPSIKDDVKIIGLVNDYGWWVFGARTLAPYYSFALNFASNSSVRAYMFCEGGSGVNITNVQKYSGRIDYETNGNKFILNGIEYDLPPRINVAINHPVYLFSLDSAGSISGNKSGNISVYWIKNKIHLCAFRLGVARTAQQVSTGVAQAPGTCGMIDLLTGIFYPNENNKGYFTIEEYSL